MSEIRVFEAFAGYGSQALALKRLAADYPQLTFRMVGFSEIDPMAITAYRALHGNKTPNFGDISHIDWATAPDFDLMTYSFPCQDISQAGNQRGFTEGVGTRSSLLWECRQAINAKRPRFLLMENVKGLLQDKFAKNFAAWRAWLESLGYKNYWSVLNAKHYGVPQNRERVFMVSIMQPAPEYSFPEPQPLERRWCDILQPDAEVHNDDLFLDAEAAAPILKSAIARTQRLKARRTSRLRMWQMGNFVDNSSYSKFLNPQRGRVYSSLTVAPTICTVDWGLSASVITPDGNIRHQTMRECFRLMDLDDDSIDRLLALNFHHRHYYKLAGNSIVVAVLYYIFKQMFLPIIQRPAPAMHPDIL